jgi:hypothetical protein
LHSPENSIVYTETLLSRARGRQRDRTAARKSSNPRQFVYNRIQLGCYRLQHF